MTVLLLQVMKDLYIYRHAGPEIAVAPLRGKGMVTLPIPEQACFTQPGTGRDDGDITF